MAALRELLATFGIEVDDKQLHQANRSLEGFIHGLKGVATATAAYFIGEGVAEIVKGSIEAGSHVKDMSERIGVSTKALQEWTFAGKLVGVTGDEIAGAFGIVQRNAAAAAGGSKEQIAAFKALGVNVKDARGELKDVDTIMMEAATGISNIENPTKRTALALQVFGRGGKALLPLLSQGAEGVAKARKEIHELGGAMDEAFIEQADEAGDNIDRFKTSVEGLKNMFAAALIPTVNMVVKGLTAVVKWFRESPRAIATVKAVLVGLAAVIGLSLIPVLKSLVVMLAPVILPVVILAAKLTVLYLIFEDLWVAIKGGDSVLANLASSIDSVLSKIPGLQQLADIGHEIGDWFGGPAGGTDEKNAEEQRKFYEEARRKNAVKAVNARGGVRKGETQKQAFDRMLAVPGGAGLLGGSEGRERIASIPVPSKGNTQIHQEMSGDVVINAPGADPHEIGKHVKRELGTMFKTAGAALPQGSGG